MGASSGIGKEVATRLIREGWTVGLAARRVDILQDMLRDAPAGSQARQIDVTTDEAAAQLRALIDDLGGVDLYLHISGIGYTNPLLEEEKELRTVATNGTGFVRMIGEAYRWMAAHDGGHIAAVTSIAGVRGLGPAPAYSATKALQHSYIVALEQQAHARHLPIRFTEIRPGFVDTPLLAGSRFPMTMPVSLVVDELLWAISMNRHQRIIDWRYRLLVFAWRLVPAWIYRRLRLGIR